MRSIRYLIILLAAALLGHQVEAASYQADLEEWITRDLTPYVTQQLKSQPRFKNETIKFVVLADSNPQSASSELAMNIRDRLRDVAAVQPGLRVVWERDSGVASGTGNIDCTRDQAHYYIGIEVVEDRGELINVELRALDVEDQSWVAGFSRSWRGYLNNSQKRQQQQIAFDSSLRGNRDAPYDESQFDLLAAHLAYELGCALLRQTAGEYIVNGSASQKDAEAEAAMLELVRNNLADFRAVQYANVAANANAVIEGKAHLIDDELYQYWVTITPSDVETDIAAISASAYIHIQDKYAIAELIPSVTVPMAKSETGFLGSLKIVELRDTRSCSSGESTLGGSRVFNSSYSPAAGDCYALEINSSSDTVMFFLNHQLNNGLVRLSESFCTDRIDAKVARFDEPLRFPLPVESLMSASWTAAESWQLNPDKDTYYAIAATDTKAARALSQHIRKLPNRCSASVRSGIEGRELQRWMDGFASIAEHWQQSIDWQVIRVKNIY
jgi:hypothetical protein